MLDALDVARHLIRAGGDPDSTGVPTSISPLHLQKLLYYCQGWTLALLGRPLFRQPLEAWVSGPVVRDVYEQFKGTRDPFTPDRAGAPTTKLSRTEAALVEMVCREYGHYQAEQLGAMTHDEPPWREARGNLPPSAPSSARLSEDTMARFFSDLVRKKTSPSPVPGYPVIDPADVWQSEEEFEQTGGKGGKPAEDVFTQLLAESDQ